MRKLFTTLLLLVLLLGGLLFFAKDLIAKVAFESAVRGLTGFNAQVRSIKLDLAKGIAHLEDLTLLNPYEFDERIFADAPEIYLHLDVPALLKKERTHIKELRINIRELNIEKNKGGTSNVSLLKPVKKTQREAKRVAPKPAMPFRLDRMILTLRRVRYNDRSSMIPKKLSVDVHVQNQLFEGIEDPKSIINIILMKVVRMTPFENIGLDPAQLQNQLKSSVKSARVLGDKLFEEAGVDVLAARTGEVGKVFWGEGRETVGQVGSTAKEEITSLFGKLRSRITSEESKETP